MREAFLLAPEWECEKIIRASGQSEIQSDCGSCE
jgi:hypothetical protein